jgi:hypothetical protein
MTPKSTSTRQEEAYRGVGSVIGTSRRRRRRNSARPEVESSREKEIRRLQPHPGVGGGAVLGRRRRRSELPAVAESRGGRSPAREREPRGDTGAREHGKVAGVLGDAATAAVGAAIAGDGGSTRRGRSRPREQVRKREGQPRGEAEPRG